MDYTATATAATDILHNRAALNSLKKEQLVKLCREHGVKVGGTKAEMASRLGGLVGSAGEGGGECGEVNKEFIQLGSIKEESGSDFGSIKSLKSLASSFGFSRSKSNVSSLSSVGKSTEMIVDDDDEPPLKEALIPLPPSPLIEPFTPPHNVDAGNTIRLVQIPTYTPTTTPTTPTRNSGSKPYGGTPYLPAFKTSFDLVMDGGGVGTPARDVAKMLRGDGMIEFGTPATRSLGFRPFLAGDVPPVPPLPKLDFGMEEGRPSIRTSVMEEMIQRAGVLPAEDRETRPLPRRSLAAVPPPVVNKTEVTRRFEKAHEEMEARMTAINDVKGKRKADDDGDEGEGRRKTARVADRGTGARPRASGVGARARPRPSAARKSGRVSTGGRRQSRLQPPPQAKKGLFGFVRGLFGSKPKETTTTKLAKAPVAKGSTNKVETTTQNLPSSSMAPPKFVPKKSASATSTSITSTTRGSVSRGSVSSTTRSFSSLAPASVSSTTRGSITSTSNTRSSTARKVSSSNLSSGVPTSSTSIRKPSISSSRLLQPTKSSLARRSSARVQTPTPPSSTVTPLRAIEPKATAPGGGIFRTPLTPATLNSTRAEDTLKSPSRIPVPVPTLASTTSSTSNPRATVLRSSSTRRPRISRTTVVARLAERRNAAESSSTRVVVRKSLAAPTPPAGRSSLAPKGRRVRSSVGAASAGKKGVLGVKNQRRSVGVVGPGARR